MNDPPTRPHSEGKETDDALVVRHLCLSPPLRLSLRSCPFSVLSSTPPGLLVLLLFVRMLLLLWARVHLNVYLFPAVEIYSFISYLNLSRYMPF